MIVAPKDQPKYVGAYDLLLRAVARALMVIEEAHESDSEYLGLQYAEQLLRDGVDMAKAAIDEDPHPPKGAA